eukprot:4488570-Pyramimonas_sp.AAC.1
MRATNPQPRRSTFVHYGGGHLRDDGAERAQLPVVVEVRAQVIYMLQQWPPLVPLGPLGASLVSGLALGACWEHHL